MMEKKIVIYGAGQYGKYTLEFLKSEGMINLVEAFCDKNYEKINSIDGIPVLPYGGNEKTIFVMAVGKKNEEEIKSILSRDHRIFFTDLGKWLEKYCEENIYDLKRRDHLLERWKEETSWQLDDSNKLLNLTYKEKNYISKPIRSDSKLCFIFFSGNGLYYPDEKRVYEDLIIKSDHYEWVNISKSEYLTNIAGKYIFVRDICKSWYVQGINDKINSIDKLVDFLRGESIEKGYRVRTVGNSAGGYMAALVGALLNAEIAFNFSGQFSLYEGENAIGRYFFIDKYKDDFNRKKYFNIVPYIRGKTPVMYFFPYYCDWDYKQSKLIENIENVYPFSFNEREHGSTMGSNDIPCVLHMEVDALKALFYKFKNQLINKQDFNLQLIEE